MRVLVCGDRNWTDKDLIRKELRGIAGLEQVMEGEARGADTIAREVAEELGIPVMGYPADWARYGRSAGMARNIQMLNQKPDLVLAFHDNISQSKGTAHTILEALKRGIPVHLCGKTG